MLAHFNQLYILTNQTNIYLFKSINLFFQIAKPKPLFYTYNKLTIGQIVLFQEYKPNYQTNLL